MQILKLSKKYRNVYAIKELNIRFKEEGLHFIAGENGAGKTTLLLIIAGLIHQSSGEVRMAAKTEIGSFIQESELYRNRTVGENLLLYAKYDRRTYENGLKYLERAGISDIINKKVCTLSNGLAKASYVLMTFAPEPEIILLDEPISGLDPILGDKILNIIKQYSEKKLVVMSSQNLIFANSFECRITVLHKGEVVLDDEMTKLKDEKHILRVLTQKAIPMKPNKDYSVQINGKTAIFRYKHDMSKKILSSLIPYGIRSSYKGNSIEGIVKETIERGDKTSQDNQ